MPNIHYYTLANYLQKFIVSPHIGEGGHTGFSADPVGVCVRVGVGVTESCTPISLEPVDGIPLNLPAYIIGTSLRAA